MYGGEDAGDAKVKPMTLAEKAALAKKNLRVIGGHKIALAPEMMYLNDRIAKDEIRRCNFQVEKYNLTRYALQKTFYHNDDQSFLAYWKQRSQPCVGGGHVSWRGEGGATDSREPST